MSPLRKTILLVEDNPGDVRLMQEVFGKSGINIKLFVAADGVEALAFLHRQNGYQESVRPDLIVLDLNLPRKDGREVLAEIKTDPNLRRIPVVVLTTSEAEEDILKIYDLNGNCYITKPADLDAFINILNRIDKFWLSDVQLPPA